MHVIGDQGLCKALGLGLGDDLTKPFYEVLSIGIITEHLPALDASDDDVMNGTGSVYSCFPRHV